MNEKVDTDEVGREVRAVLERYASGDGSIELAAPVPQGLKRSGFDQFLHVFRDPASWIAGTLSYCSSGLIDVDPLVSIFSGVTISSAVSGLAQHVRVSRVQAEISAPQGEILFLSHLSSIDETEAASAAARFFTATIPRERSGPAQSVPEHLQLPKVNPFSPTGRQLFQMIV